MKFKILVIGVLGTFFSTHASKPAKQEYVVPGQENIESKPQDTANTKEKELQGYKDEITAALLEAHKNAQINSRFFPGTPAQNVTQFSKVLDYFDKAITAYRSLKKLAPDESSAKGGIILFFDMINPKFNRVHTDSSLDFTKKELQKRASAIRRALDEA